MSIVQSLLDIDYYKLTMAQLAFHRHPAVPVRFGFLNRTSEVCLPEFVDEDQLRAELDHVRSLRFTSDELDFLRESPHVPRGLFSEEFLAFLAGLRLPDFELARESSTYRIEVEASWPEVTCWETLSLCVVTELYGRALMDRHGVSNEEAWAEGERRLARKIELVRGEPRVRFSDFGTRRRFSLGWQRRVIDTLARELPKQFVGTSNVLLAKEVGLRPIGTSAHELDMVYSGICHGSEEEIRSSHGKVLDDWWAAYGEPLSIALTDTYGTDFFFRAFAPERARAWRGLRHDSGDPIEFGEKAVRFYEGLGIDPRTKMIVFSDGLEVDTILKLVDRFADRIRVVFGWGTNLTNDVGFRPLSLVVKVISACGHETVKLSDNLDKATGTEAAIKRFVHIFGHEEAPPRLGVKY